MSDFERFLTEKGTTIVDPSHLKVMGKKAAANYLSDGTDLNESIAKFSKEASLNDEQTKRVVEHANTATFLGLFKAGYDSNVKFPVADYEKVAQAHQPAPSAQKEIPLLPSQSYVPGQEYVTLEEAFFVEPASEKVASEEWTSNDVNCYFRDRYAVKQASADLEILNNRFELQFDRVNELMGQLHKDGETGYDIALTIKEAGVVRELADMLVSNSGITVETSDSKQDVVVDKSHALFKEASVLSATLSDILSAKANLSELVESSEAKRKEDFKALL